MALSKLALACVLLMAGQPPSPDVVYTKLRTGRIPAEVPQSRADEILALRLFVSSDQGRTYSIMDTITPDKEGFRYETSEDGEYWFHVVAIRKHGPEEPENFAKLPPRMRLIIDTQPPIVKIVTAQQQGSELVVSWEVQDKNLDVATLTVEYRTADGSSWAPMSFTPQINGTAKATLTSAAVTVRVQCKDKAGNLGEAEKPLAGDVATAGYNPAVSTASATAPQPELTPHDAVSPPSPPIAPPVANPPPTMPQPAQGMLPVPGVASSGQFNSAPKDQGSVVPPSPPSYGSKRPAPALQIINSCEILLEYRVSKVGPSGIGAVEVWMTRDGGMTWALYAKDESAMQANAEGICQRTLQLRDGDGVYGISLVVKSNAGIGKPAPRPGDTPEMLVEVDTTPPEAKLVLPLTPNPALRNSLIVSWYAKDRNLGSKAVKLEWAERPEGPWRLICADQPNTGRYLWQLPQTMPSYVYLRLAVRDNAGNVSTDVTRDPQLVDMSEPEVQFIRVAPVDRK
jgi:hypothetical protein